MTRYLYPNREKTHDWVMIEQYADCQCHWGIFSIVIAKYIQDIRTMEFVMCKCCGESIESMDSSDLSGIPRDEFRQSDESKSLSGMSGLVETLS